MVNTVDGIDPITNATRWDNSAKKKISVPQPSLIKKYNENMGGVDRLDQNVSYYRVGIRSKKWYFQLIAFGIDAAVQNSWQLYRKEPGNKEDGLGFRRKIVQAYLLAAKTRQQYKTRRNPKKIASRVPETIRYDNRNHHITHAANQSLCAVCKRNSRSKCAKCDVNLHNACWKDFHGIL